MQFITRYKDLNTLIIREKTHRTEKGRTTWIAKQTTAGNIQALTLSEIEPKAKANTKQGLNVVQSLSVTPNYPATTITETRTEDGRIVGWVIQCEGTDCASQHWASALQWAPVDHRVNHTDVIQTTFTAPNATRCAHCGPFPHTLDH